jgi:hypothetical protein
MLDESGKRDLDFDTFVAEVKQCKNTARQLRCPGLASGATNVLVSLSSAVQQRLLELGKFFRDMDSRKEGALPFVDVVRVFKHVVKTGP